MKFLLDENVEHRLALFLTEQGHDCASIAHDYPGALADDDVLEIARRDRRILITNDLDFGELAVRWGTRHFGIVLFRLPAGDVAAKTAALTELLAIHSEQMRQFFVIDSSGVRIRPADA